MQVTSPDGGAISIANEESATPEGYGVVGSQCRTEAPPASAADPLQVNIVLAESSLLVEETKHSIDVLRDGVPSTSARLPTVWRVPSRASPPNGRQGDRVRSIGTAGIWAAAPLTS